MKIAFQTKKPNQELTNGHFLETITEARATFSESAIKNNN